MPGDHLCRYLGQGCILFSEQLKLAVADCAPAHPCTPNERCYSRAGLTKEDVKPFPVSAPCDEDGGCPSLSCAREEQLVRREDDPVFPYGYLLEIKVRPLFEVECVEPENPELPRQAPLHSIGYKLRSARQGFLRQADPHLGYAMVSVIGPLVVLIDQDAGDHHHAEESRCVGEVEGCDGRVEV